MTGSPDARRVLLRVLVRGLALFLVPVVLVASPNVANAATIYGDGVSFGVELSDMSSDSMTCSGVGQWVVPDTTGLLSPYVKFADIKCPLTFLLGNQTSCDSDDCSNLLVEVLGDGCSASGRANISGGTPDWASFGGPSLTLAASCVVTHLCLTFDGYANSMPDLGTGRECVAWPLGAAPAAPVGGPSCSAGMPTSLTYLPHSLGSSSQYDQFDVTFTGFPGGAVDTTWTTVAINAAGATRVLNGGFTRTAAGTVRFGAYESNDYVGFTIAYTGAGSTAATKGDIYTVGAFQGTTQPANCIFHFGAKRADIAGTTIDEPMFGFGATGGADSGTPLGSGASPTPPPSDTVDEGCAAGFSIWNPTTWATAGYCEIVSSLSTVARAVTSIPSKILGGLSALFVPANAPSWSDVPNPLPGGWVPDFPSVSASSCGPLTMPRLELGFDNMHVGPVSMVDTCDDPWPLARTFVFNGLLASVLVTLLWRAYAAVSSSLGMGLDTGRGEEE